jgi:hypothetical protein
MARESEGVARMSAIAGAALVIAAELSITKPPHGPTLLLQIRDRAASLDNENRDHVQGRVRLLLHYYLPLRTAED